MVAMRVDRVYMCITLPTIALRIWAWCPEVHMRRMIVENGLIPSGVPAITDCSLFGAYIRQGSMHMIPSRAAGTRSRLARIIRIARRQMANALRMMKEKIVFYCMVKIHHRPMPWESIGFIAHRRI